MPGLESFNYNADESVTPVSEIFQTVKALNASIPIGDGYKRKREKMHAMRKEKNVIQERKCHNFLILPVMHGTLVSPPVKHIHSSIHLRLMLLLQLHTRTFSLRRHYLSRARIFVHAYTLIKVSNFADIIIRNTSRDNKVRIQPGPRR